jgi:hypothetical protein
MTCLKCAERVAQLEQAVKAGLNWDEFVATISVSEPKTDISTPTYQSAQDSDSERVRMITEFLNEPGPYDVAKVSALVEGLHASRATQDPNACPCGDPNPTIACVSSNDTREPK